MIPTRKNPGLEMGKVERGVYHKLIIAINNRLAVRIRRAGLDRTVQTEKLLSSVEPSRE